jgi:hypothetical protein
VDYKEVRMAKWSGRVGNTGILDLTWAKSIEDLNEITAIENVGIVRVPEHLYAFVASIPQEKVGMVETAASGPQKTLTGQVRLTGDFLAAGDPETTLVVTGVLFILPPLVKIGFREIRLTGIILLPRGSEGVISNKLGSLTGNVVYYSADASMPRLFMGQESIGREFLELLPTPVPFVVTGKLTIEADVTLDLLRAKVPEIVLTGQLVAPKALIPLLQVLTVDKTGTIQVLEQEGTPPEPFAVSA